MKSTHAVALSAALLLSACGSHDSAQAQGAADSSQSLSKAMDSTEVTADTSWLFDDVAIGTLPEGWMVEATRPRGQRAQWSVQPQSDAPSGKQVLALTDTRDASRSTFNLAWTDQVSFLDGTVEVTVKAGTGQEDQGGGPIWRVQDKDNYYIARWNPLEDNIRLYYVKSGNRSMLKSAQANLPADEWHTINIRHQGNDIQVFLDGRQVMQATDDTFLTAGGVGVWTKADAGTSFDDFVVNAASSR